jgi:hypothetical protein
MSDSYENLYRFFSNLGFSIERSERFDSFGDYTVEACSTHFCVKGVSDRSIEWIEFRSLNDPGNWYIPEIVMSFVLKKDDLIVEHPLETQMKFLESHLDELGSIFDDENYHKTKAYLQGLEAKDLSGLVTT